MSVFQTMDGQTFINMAMVSSSRMKEEETRIVHMTTGNNVLIFGEDCTRFAEAYSDYIQQKQLNRKRQQESEKQRSEFISKLGETLGENY